MARAKKQKLSLEQLLEQALVKEEEYPYRVPSNWIWTSFGNLFRPMTTKKPNKDEEFFRYIDIEVIDNKRQCISEPKTILVKDAPSRASREIDYGDTLFSLVRPYLKNIAYVEEKYKDCIASTGFYVCKPRSIVYPLYLYNLLRSEYVVNTLNQFMKGDNSPSIRGGDLEMCSIPLPPLEEQRRIVKRIESLFEKLDTAKELAQNALDSFENRKAAILHKAFTGELTVKWREENGVSLDSWKEREFKDVATVKGNLVDPSEYLEFPHIAPNNIEKRTGKFLEYRTIKEDQVTSGKHRFYSGQILYSKIRPYLSKVVVVDFDGLCSADMYPIETDLDTKFLWYYMLSDDFLMQASSAGSRSVLPKINQKELGKISVIQPTMNEQKEIVSILDNILDNEQQAQELCDVIEKIDFMKKAILARAFRGELDTNNPEEESAIGLLKQVLKEKL